MKKENTLKAAKLIYGLGHLIKVLFIILLFIILSIIFLASVILASIFKVVLVKYKNVQWFNRQMRALWIPYDKLYEFMRNIMGAIKEPK